MNTDRWKHSSQRIVAVHQCDPLQTLYCNGSVQCNCCITMKPDMKLFHFSNLIIVVFIAIPQKIDG